MTDYDYEKEKDKRLKLLRDLTDRIEKIDGITYAGLQGGTKYYSQSSIEIEVDGDKGEYDEFWTINPNLRSIAQKIRSEIKDTDRVSGYEIMSRPEKRYKDKIGKGQHVGYTQSYYIIDIGMA